jgi:hypothetical protein
MLLEDTQTHYYVLGLSERPADQVTDLDIKKAYCRLARQCHPDVVGTKDTAKLKQAEERFKRINLAYETLIDPLQRKEYDRTFHRARFVAEPVSTWPPSDWTPPAQPSYQMTVWEERHAQKAWDEFISKPFEWSEKSLRFYQRWEWVAAIASIYVIWIVATGQLTTLDMFTFLLTTQSHPDVESAMPVQVALIGTWAAFGVTVIVAGWAVITHRYSFRRNSVFRA